MDTYKVGNGTRQITLAADIDTFGLAASRAIVLDLASDDPATTVATSVDATGDISPKDIGPANTLSGKRLSVMTKIDLVGSLPDREREADRLGGKYILDEGPDGHQTFTRPQKIVSDDVTSVILFFRIDLIP